MQFTRAVAACGSALALALVGAAAATAATRPDTIALPNGFAPEGITTGPGAVAYAGSLADGSIFRADLRTGQGEVFSGPVGSPSVGIELDRLGRLFVAGGHAGNARVVDAVTGEVEATYQLGADPSFINDVVVTDDAAWFTDSANQVLHRVPLGRFGQLPSPEEVEDLPLTGDFAIDADPATFEANGIEATPDGQALLVVQSRTGHLFRVDPRTGQTTQVDLGGETLVNGDGITLDGRTLYVVQNRLNTVAVVRLQRDGTAGEVQERVTDEDFDVPTTVARSGNSLYLVNARFGVEPSPEEEYEIVRIDRP